MDTVALDSRVHIMSHEKIFWRKDQRYIVPASSCVNRRILDAPVQFSRKKEEKKKVEALYYFWNEKYPFVRPSSFLFMKHPLHLSPWFCWNNESDNKPLLLEHCVKEGSFMFKQHPAFLFTLIALLNNNILFYCSNQMCRVCVCWIFIFIFFWRECLSRQQGLR